ncbi:zinc finger, CCHC-type containing protein, partial [Tanacetum coccineum]
MLTACYLLNRVPYKRIRITPYELWTKRKPNLNYLRVWGCRAVVRLLDPKLKTMGKRGIECIFVGYVDHSKAFSQKSLINETEDINGSVVPEEVTDEVVQQPELELRKSKRNRTPKNFGLEFQLYLIKGTRDEDVAFWKEAIKDEMDSIMGNNTWVLTDLPPVCKPLGCIWIFKRKLKDDLKNEFLSSRFFMKDMGEADVILGIGIIHESNRIAISQSYYIENVLKNSFTLIVLQLIAFVVGKLSFQEKNTCITGSTMESEFVPLAAAGKVAKRLGNLIFEILL